MFKVIFSILVCVGILIVMYGTYEEFYMHKKKTLIIGAAISAASMLYFVVDSYNRGVDNEFFGTVIFTIFFTVILLIAVFKKEEE